MTISQRNKNNRALQTAKNRGGTASYSSAAFKKKKDRLAVYFDAHTNKKGEFEDPANEEYYNELCHEIEEETQAVASSSNTQTRVNEAAVFEKVLGPRRGRIRGIGIKPSTMPTSSQYDEGHPRASQQTQPDIVDTIISDPRVRETVSTIYQSLSTQHPVNDEADDEGNDEDDEVLATTFVATIPMFLVVPSVPVTSPVDEKPMRNQRSQTRRNQRQKRNENIDVIKRNKLIQKKLKLQVSNEMDLENGNNGVVSKVKSGQKRLQLMADVMGRGHGGDGAEDPPPPHGRGLVPPQRRRGKTKNLQLTPTWMGIIISRDIPLDKDGWRKVPAEEKNALLEHLRPYFDVDSVMVEPEKVRLRSAFETMLANSYKGQKNNAKKHFNRSGGYQDIERARNTPPSNITPENWRKAVNFFIGESHMTVSQRNKNNRALQTTKNRGGTASYSSAAFKKNELCHEIEEETQAVASSSNTQTRVNEAAVFEKVLGPRRGRIRGIGIKPSTMPTSSQYDEGHPRASQQTQPDIVDTIISDPRVRETVSTIYQSLSTQHPVNDEADDEGNDEDDE
ncbi:hypothetical protein LXL04_008229 [Taraxacum kok-saghyz]